MKNNSYPSLCSIDMTSFKQYDSECFYNDIKALQALKSIIPGMIDPEKVVTLAKVQNGMDIIKKTVHNGEVIVHIFNDFPSVEFRCKFPNIEDKTEKQG
ncbi:MAG: hypothetical protein V1858_02120 [Candidatus Gottesmanbacteria bacterium]